MGRGSEGFVVMSSPWKDRDCVDSENVCQGLTCCINYGVSLKWCVRINGLVGLIYVMLDARLYQALMKLDIQYVALWHLVMR
jgi:hypothetical protein